MKKSADKATVVRDKSVVPERSTNGSALVPQVDRPPEITIPRGALYLEQDLPRLNADAARTVARDRWERMISERLIPASPDAIWQALTDPDQMRGWLASCEGSLGRVETDCVLDFEDGDFFLCRSIEARPPHYLEYRWRWLGVGPSWSVKWYIEEDDHGSRVVVVDEAMNPPARTGHYRGEGWPGILDILASYLRIKTPQRWLPRSQSYILVDLPVTIYGAWDRLFSPAGLKWWLHGFHGQIIPSQSVAVHMGDASGSLELAIAEVVPPSYNTYPFVTFSTKKPFWPREIPGRLFLEPGGWGSSILQVFQTDWETLGPQLHPLERQTVVAFWAAAFQRARQVCEGRGLPAKASPWVLTESGSDHWQRADAKSSLDEV